MKCNDILDNCQRLLLDIYKITPVTIDGLCFIMNTKHLKTISEHYGFEVPDSKIIQTTIFGHNVIHNEHLPMNSILLGYEKQVNVEL
jgi:hypothetical protein